MAQDHPITADFVFLDKGLAEKRQPRKSTTMFI